MLSPHLSRLLAFPLRNVSVRRRWAYIGHDRSDAFKMMDGSSSEAELRRRGAHMADVLVPALGIKTTHQVLEVGCGVARVGRELAPCCALYHGVDISRPLLALARARTSDLGNVELTHLAGPGLDGLPAACYHRLICHLVLLHLDETGVRRLLRGFARVLRDDGVAYFDLWNAGDADAGALARRELLDRRIRRQPHRSRFYRRQEVEGWLAVAGLDAVWVSDATFLIQIIAVRQDAPEGVRRALTRRLAAAGPALLPRGRLEFTGL